MSDQASSETPEPPPPPAAPGITLETIKAALREVLEGDVSTPMTPRYAGGTLVLKPAKDDLKAKEIPIEEFFKKVVRVRDQLRVLEQKINNHERLSDADKAGLQTYLTRSYGALTSFNLLFKDKDDSFRGQTGK